MCLYIVRFRKFYIDEAEDIYCAFFIVDIVTSTKCIDNIYKERAKTPNFFISINGKEFYRVTVTLHSRQAYSTTW